MAQIHFCIVFQLLVLTRLNQISAFPTPTASSDDKSVYNQQLTEERPLQEQIAEADSVKAALQSAESKQSAISKEPDRDDLPALKSLAQGQKSKEASEDKDERKKDDYVPDESDSTKSRRLAEEYDSTKNGMEHDDTDTFRQVDGTPLTPEDIVQKIANKIYQEDDRGVFDRIVSKLLKLGLITESQADTLEYQVAEALQDLITKNAKNNEIEDEEEVEDTQDANSDKWEPPNRRYDDDDEEVEDDDDVMDEVERDAEDEDDTVWNKDVGEDDNEVNPEDGLRDLQYFPNFYRLLRSLNSDQDAQERETLITIMKTLIDFVKMMVKYGTITPEEGVSYLENLDAMIAMQTKNKLGKVLGPPDFAGNNAGKNFDEDDNTKAEAARMQKEYENLKDSTKDEQPSTNRPGKSETYLEAIRKNIEWLKKHNKEEGKDDYDLSKLKDFMDQQVDSYIEKGIIARDEGDTIKRIYSSL
ncbi:secretogranin-3 isoform X1 [Corythoichthys intestinalis]|uniref:secretogranin-3 isoform X1 n=1 Tax=Corythoichthys intestinalis TaxID=161448 RepID=UPI0025A511E4|nr:secretogranin-3 isoform X1 [Corythoichthys intestinalis]